MSVQTVVTFGNSNKSMSIEVDGREILETLGTKEQNLALQLKEVLSSVKESVCEVLDAEGELQIEITGSLDLKTAGGVSYLLFNVGGEASKTNSMTVQLRTKISPKKRLTSRSK